MGLLVVITPIMLTKVSVASAVLLSLCLCHVGCSSVQVSKRQVLTNELRTCIEDSVEDISPQCSNVLQYLFGVYSSTNILLDISRNRGVFPVFCNPSCGQVLINAWESCGGLEDRVVASVASLLARMCDNTEDGQACYINYLGLSGFLGGAINCTREYFATGRCSSTCSSGARDAVLAFDCCVNAVLDFESSLNEQVDFGTSVTEARYTNGQFNKVFSECGTERPQRCNDSPLMLSAAPTQMSTLLLLSTVFISAVAALMCTH